MTQKIVGLLGWGGFGLRAHRTGTTPLRRMLEEGATLSPGVTLSEYTAAWALLPFNFSKANFLYISVA